MSPLQHLCVGDLSSCSHMADTCCYRNKPQWYYRKNENMKRRKKQKENKEKVAIFSSMYDNSLNIQINLCSSKVSTMQNTLGISMMVKILQCSPHIWCSKDILNWKSPIFSFYFTLLNCQFPSWKSTVPVSFIFCKQEVLSYQNAFECAVKKYEIWGFHSNES